MYFTKTLLESRVLLSITYTYKFAGLFPRCLGAKWLQKRASSLAIRQRKLDGSMGKPHHMTYIQSLKDLVSPDPCKIMQTRALQNDGLPQKHKLLLTAPMFLAL